MTTSWSSDVPLLVCQTSRCGHKTEDTVLASAQLPQKPGNTTLRDGVTVKRMFCLSNCKKVSEIALKAQTVFLEQANLLKKVNFPRLCLPVVVVGNGLLNFTIIALLFTAFLALVGSLPGLEALALLPIVALTVWFAVALGIALGILNVFFRDVGHFFSVVLQFWFWLTPIVYPLTILPPMAQGLMGFNPLAGLIVAAQDVVLKEVWPDWSSLAPAAVVAVLMSVLAVRLYVSRGAEMQDEL